MLVVFPFFGGFWATKSWWFTHGWTGYVVVFLGTAGVAALVQVREFEEGWENQLCHLEVFLVFFRWLSGSDALMLAEFLLQGMCIATLRLWMQQLVGFNDVFSIFNAVKSTIFPVKTTIFHGWNYGDFAPFLGGCGAWQAQQRPALCVVKAFSWVAMDYEVNQWYSYGTRILGDDPGWTSI